MVTMNYYFSFNH